MHIRQSFEHFNVVLRWSSGISEQVTLYGHGEPKATMSPVEIAERGLWWE